MPSLYTSWENLKNAISNNPNKHCSLPTQKQTTHIIIEAEPDWLTSLGDGNNGVKGWKTIHEGMPAHPITIACSLQDPLFRHSNKSGHANAIRTLISEFSQRFDSVYKENNGRSRGWIKKDFVAWFLRTEAQDSWTWHYEACLKDKLSSAVCDFISITIPNTTIAVFLPGLKRITYYPTGEKINDRVICIDGSTGNWITPPNALIATKNQFSLFTSTLGWKWIAPASVSVNETVTELKQKIQSIGGASLPTLTKHELVGWNWRQKFLMT